MYRHNPNAPKDSLTREAAARTAPYGCPPPAPDAFRMLRLLGMIFRTQARWQAIGMIGAIVAITVSEVMAMLRLATWNADFFDLLEQRSLSGLATQAWIFVAIVASLMLLQAASLQTKLYLQVLFRTHLTRTVSEAWMSNGQQVRIRDIGSTHDNEDGRIAEDARIVCEMIVEFLVSLLYAVLQLVSFIGVLWLYSGPLTIAVGGNVVTLPGHMVWVALLYAGFGAAITIFIGHPLVRAAERRQAAEAAYRATLANAVAHASAIALASAEGGERRRLATAFEHIRHAWKTQIISLRNLIFFSAGYGQITPVLPILILAPRYFDGDMTLGTLMQVTIAFGQVTGALSWISSNFSSIAQWEASAERVLKLHDAVTSVGDGHDPSGSGRFLRLQMNGPNLTFKNLSLVTPDGEVLVKQFSGEIKPGELVVIEATPQAAEALFRAVAGLSLWGAGRIELPEDTTIFFMGECPYLPSATLLDVLIEPQTPEGLGETEVAQVLAAVGLTQLVPLIDTAAVWEQELGIEEQQRLGFARAILHRPRWILIHDAASALDAKTEENLMDLMMRQLPDTTLIAIAHRPISEWRFERRISLSVESA